AGLLLDVPSPPLPAFVERRTERHGQSVPLCGTAAQRPPLSPAVTMRQACDSLWASGGEGSEVRGKAAPRNSRPLSPALSPAGPGAVGCVKKRDRGGEGERSSRRLVGKAGRSVRGVPLVLLEALKDTSA